MRRAREQERCRPRRPRLKDCGTNYKELKKLSITQQDVCCGPVCLAAVERTQSPSRPARAAPHTGTGNKEEPASPRRWLHSVSGVMKPGSLVPGFSFSLEQQPHAGGAICSGRSCQLPSRRSLQSPLFSLFVSRIWLPVANWNKWSG